jgi:hypothetical protein
MVHKKSSLTLRYVIYYTLVIISSYLITSGLGLNIGDTRTEDESLGISLIFISAVIITILLFIQNNLLKDEHLSVRLIFFNRKFHIKRTFFDILIFQYFFYAFALLLGSFLVWRYTFNGPIINFNLLIITISLLPIVCLIVYHNVSNFFRRLIILFPLIMTFFFWLFVKILS